MEIIQASFQAAMQCGKHRGDGERQMKQSLSFKHQVLLAVLMVAGALVCWSNGWRISAVVAEPSLAAATGSLHTSKAMARKPRQLIPTAAKKVADVSQAVASAVEHFDFVIQSFDPSAR